MTERRLQDLRRAYVAIGSNLDDPIAKVRAGIAALRALPQTRLDQCSSLYRTAPVGPVTQPDFINAVCRIITSLSPEALLQHFFAIEASHGRVRQSQKWGPRTLDLDLLMYDDRVLVTPNLTVPHPRLHERAFVLYPLLELDPELIVPGHGRVVELLGDCSDQRVQKLEIEP